MSRPGIRWTIGVLFLLFAAALGAMAAPQGGAKVRVGILPVYDLSGEIHGEVFAQNLTFMIFEELRKTSVEPVLLNPGGAYTPDGTEWIVEHAQTVGVDAVFISTLLHSNRPKNGDWSLRVECQFLVMKSGYRTSPEVYGQEISKKDLKRGLEVGISDPHWYGPSRPFEKQPLGKAARKIAKEMRDKIVTQASGVAPGGTGEGAASGSTCSIDFRVLYTDRKASSKSFSVVVNGREESLELKDGMVSVSLPSGPVVIHSSPMDAPYKLPSQRMYMANTWLDCSRPQRTLVLEIGAAGEGLLRWR